MVLACPKSADVLLWANVPVEGSLPLLTSNRVGIGKAYFSTVTESAFSEAIEVLDHLWKEAIGEPVWRIDEDPGRYSVILRQQKGRTLAHIADDLSWHGGPMTRYRPQYVHLRLNSGVVPFQKATLVPENQSIQTSKDGTWKVLELYPNVEITLLLDF